MSAKRNSKPSFHFRRLVADKGKTSLKRAVTGLLEKMPPNGSPPFPQMRELASAGEWEKKLNPATMREALEGWVKLMDELSAGSGRSPNTAEKNFVGALAHYWEKELGAKPENSRSWANQPREFEQKGLFPDFVRKAAEIIPAEYRPASWDHAIREITKPK